MRIAVISSQVFQLTEGGLSHYGGLEVVAWHCARGLAQRGHQVSLVAPDGSMCPGVHVIQSGPAGQWDEAKAYDRYWRELPSFACIVDHSWSKHSYMLKAEGRLKAPVLGVTHAPVDTMFKKLPPVEKPCITCISKDQAEHFKALFGRPAKFVHNGIDLSYYKPMSVPRSDRFLFLARFSTIKGPDIAIQACKEAGVPLDVIGDTQITGEPELLKRCMEMADGKQIRIVGSVPRGETVWWYSQARCMLHPNQRFREPFGLAPVESMACGCPVIAWDNGAMRETVTPQSGMLVSSYEGFVAAIKGIAEYGVNDASRAACRENAKRFSVENMVAGYDKLCQEVVKTGGW